MESAEGSPPPKTRTDGTWAIALRQTRWPTAFVARGEVPHAVMTAFSTNEAFIFFLEALTAMIGGLVAAQLDTSDWISFIDNEPAKYALIKGYTGNAQVNTLLATFWEFQVQEGLSPWFERVTSKANVADAVSRDDLSFAQSQNWPEVLLPLDNFFASLTAQSFCAQDWRAFSLEIKTAIDKVRTK